MADTPQSISQEDLAKVFKELLVERKRISQISDNISKFIASSELKSVQEINKQLLDLRSSFKGDIDSYTKYLKDMVSDTSNVLISAEEAYRDIIKRKKEIEQESKKSSQEYLEEIKKEYEKLGQDINLDRLKVVLDEMQGVTKDTADNIKESLKDIFSANIEAQIAKLQEDIKTVGQDDPRLSKAEIRDLQDKIKLRIEELEKQKKLNDTKAESTVNDKLKKQLEKEMLDLQQKELELSIPLTKYEKQRLENSKELEGSMSGVLDKMFNTSKESTILSKSLFSIFGDAGGLKSGINNFWESVTNGIAASFLNPQASIARVVNYIDKNLVQSTFEFDKQMASVNRNTGGFGKEFERIATIAEGPFKMSAVGGLSQYGITLEKFGAAYTSLSKTVGNFNNLLDSQRKLLAENASQLANLNLSAETYGKLTSQFMGVLGRTVAGTQKAINDVARDAITLGKDIGQYASELESLMPKITGFGREATVVFKELSALSQATAGALSAADLSNLASTFDTFENGAQAIAKVNMVLGGTSANLLDLMKLDPSERIMSIKRSFDQTGQSFESLNIGYKRVLAELFGGDVSKAAAFFKMDLAEAQDLMDKQVASEEELEERKKKSAAAQEKLTAAIDSMKIAFTPIIDMVADFANIISKVTSIPGGPLLAFFTGLIPLIGGAVFAFTRLKNMAQNALQSAVAPIKELQTQIITLRTEIEKLNAAASGTGTNITKGATQGVVKAEENAMKVAGGAPAAGGGKGGMSASAKFGIGLAAVGIIGGIASSWAQSEKEERERKRKEDAELLKPMEEASMQDGFVVGNKYVKIDNQDQVSQLANNTYMFNKPGGAIQNFISSAANQSANQSESMQFNSTINNNLMDTSKQLLGAATEVQRTKESTYIKETANTLKESLTTVMPQYPDKLAVSLNIPEVTIGERVKHEFIHDVGESQRRKF